VPERPEPRIGDPHHPIRDGVGLVFQRIVDRADGELSLEGRPGRGQATEMGLIAEARPRPRFGRTPARIRGRRRERSLAPRFGWPGQ
jgi:hypothetical protein